MTVELQSTLSIFGATLSRTKQVEIEKRFIKEKLGDGQICIPSVKLERQLPNILSKGLSYKIFNLLYTR